MPESASRGGVVCSGGWCLDRGVWSRGAVYGLGGGVPGPGGVWSRGCLVQRGGGVPGLGRSASVP